MTIIFPQGGDVALRIPDSWTVFTSRGRQFRRTAEAIEQRVGEEWVPLFTREDHVIESDFKEAV